MKRAVPTDFFGVIVGEKMGWMHGIAGTMALAWMIAIPVSAWAAGGYIFDAVGSVSVAAGKNPPRPVVRNDTVASGTVIRTGDNSHAVLKFEDGQIVSMQANSTFQVREYRYVPNQVEESSILFSMFKGGMRFVTGHIGQRNPGAFRLATPSATIGIRGTEFLVVMANNATYSQVLSGSVSMSNAAGMTILTAGQTALTSSAAALATPIPAASVPAGTFSQVVAIPVPAAVPAPVPPPASGALTGSTAASSGTTAATAETAAATATPAATAGTAATTSTTAAGGAAAGGAAASTAAATGGLVAGVSATTIGIGVGVAAVAVAVVNSSATQH